LLGNNNIVVAIDCAATIGILVTMVKKEGASRDT
jgi:hypothetical protein